VSFWKNKKVLVTGGSGFIGSHLCEALKSEMADVSILSRIPQDMFMGCKVVTANLKNLPQCVEAIKDFDHVMHLAADVGGIEYNMNSNFSIFNNNVIMSSNVLQAIQDNNIQAVTLVSSACVYARDAEVPTPESAGFLDLPEETNLGYGLAKRTMEQLGQTMYKYSGKPVTIVRPSNAYGPKDKFDPKVAHVVAALVNKAVTKDEIVVWGNGLQTRSFIYVKDIVQGILLASEKSKDATPINLACDDQITIKDLVEKIVYISGSNANVVFDKSIERVGYRTRQSDTRLARELLGFEAKTSIDEGLKRTIEYFKASIQ